MDRERIFDKLDELKDYLRDLEEDLPQKESVYLQGRTQRRACEKDFELICETLVDICNLLISGKELGKPADNKDSVDKLIKNSIIPQDLGDRIKNMLGLRNLLVHKYAKIDDTQVYTHFKNETSDIYEFLEKINEFLEK